MRCFSNSSAGRLPWVAVAAGLLAFCGLAVSAGAAPFVIHISVDGLRPDGITNLGAAELPNFYKFRTEGAFTDNARTDYDMTITLPNHTSQLSGRPVEDRFGVGSGHHYTNNNDPAAGVTLATNAGYYIASAFDVAHDNGLRTGLYATKSKFSLFTTSYNATHGAPDLIGVDDGKNKIDHATVNEKATAAMMTSLLSAMASDATRSNYTFVHFHDTDTAGHDFGWNVTSSGSQQYRNSLKTVDGYLGQIFNLISTTPELAGNTAVILTTDHGGGKAAGSSSTSHHNDVNAQVNYQIPFYVWGDGVLPGDLYQMNLGTRLDPGVDRVTYAGLQPIRNGDAANLALDLLGLGAVPGSSINFAQTLAVPEPSAAALMTTALAALGVVRRRQRRNGR